MLLRIWWSVKNSLVVWQPNMSIGSSRGTTWILYCTLQFTFCSHMPPPSSVVAFCNSLVPGWSRLLHVRLWTSCNFIQLEASQTEVYLLMTVNPWYILAAPLIDLNRAIYRNQRCWNISTISLMLMLEFIPPTKNCKSWQRHYNADTRVRKSIAPESAPDFVCDDLIYLQGANTNCQKFRALNLKASICFESSMRHITCTANKYFSVWKMFERTTTCSKYKA